MSFSGFAQTKEIDSLLQVVKTVDDGKSKASVYGRLGWLHITIDTEIASRYLDSSATIYDSLNYEAGFYNIQYKRALINRLTGNYTEGLKQIDEFINYKKSHGDSISVADALFQKGVIIGLKGDFSEGLKTYYRALAIYERNNDSYSAANIHNSIGIIFKNFGQLDKALESYKKAEKVQIEIEDKKNLAFTYGNIGNVYALKKDFDSALEYFDRSLKLHLELNSEYGIALNSQNIGHTLFDQNKLEKALPYYQTAYKIQKKNNYEAEFLETLASLSQLHGQQGNYALSKSYLEEAEKLNINFNIGNQEFHKAYYKFHESQGDFKESLHHFKQYSVLKDSIFTIDNQHIINGLRLQYQSEKKDKEIVKQQLDLEKSQAKTKTMTILIISLLLTSILLWFLFQQRQKRIEQQLVTIKKEQEVLTLESLIAGEEKERMRIAQELHDGVNGDLSAIKFKLTSLLKMNNTVINEAVTMIDNSCKQVRAISHNLVPPSLKDFNLTEAIASYCENMNSTHKPEVRFQYIGDAIDLNKKVEVNIFRIIQELVTNALKHADASTIDVQISNRENTLLITVEDNGKGYENKLVETNGIGMSNVKSRVEYLNANLEVVTNTDGTSNTIDVDLDKL